MSSACSSPSPPDKTGPTTSHSRLSRSLGHPWLLLSSVLIAGLLFGTQLTVQLLPIFWQSEASEWIRTIAAWLAVLVLVRVSWLFRKN
ncbi:MAG TPA: hypothetical protein VH593_05615, partial [Ktedonobacteraceae bacterium]